MATAPICIAVQFRRANLVPTASASASCPLILICNKTTNSASSPGREGEGEWFKGQALPHENCRLTSKFPLASSIHCKSGVWPSVSAAPVRKDHITDWITSQTSKGLAFKTGEFKPAAIQVTEDVAVACYWITFKWLDKDGNGAANTIRITHVWLRTGNDWRIKGGMSMPEPDTPRK